MPRGHRAKAADELEMMDMDEAVAELEAAADEEAEQEKMITISTAYFYALQETLANIGRHDKLEANEWYLALQALLRDILLHQHRSDVSSTLTHCITLFYFLYPHTVDIVQFKFGVCVHILFLIMQFILNYGLNFFGELNLMNT
jgi:hypothetical protein